MGELRFAKNLKTAVILIIELIIITGLFYPLLMVGIGEGLFTGKAGGSLLYEKGRPVGSYLIGQNFSQDRYFHPRPSAVRYDSSTSGATNLGPTNKKLLDQITERARRDSLGFRGPVPVDIVTSSGSGLDPDISPAAAYMQVKRVAKARGVSESKIRALVDKMTASRQLAFLGEKRVNVLSLNIELDTSFSKK